MSFIYLQIQPLYIFVAYCCVLIIVISMSNDFTPIHEIGSELLEESRKDPDAGLPLSTRLFPYIFVASRKMSLRAISSWLKDKQGVNLSAAAISRALNSPAMHLERLAESYVAESRHIALRYEKSITDLLYGTFHENGPLEIQELAFEEKYPESDNEEDIQFWADLKNLADSWSSIPSEVRSMLRPYINNLTCEDDEHGI